MVPNADGDKKKRKNCRRISIDFARDMRHRVLIWRRRSTCGNLIRLGFFLIVRFQSLFIYSPAPMISSLSPLPPLDLLTCYFSLSCWMFNWLFIEERSTPHPSIYVRDPRWAFQNLFHMKKKTGKKINISMPTQQDRGRNDRRIKLIIKPKRRVVWVSFSSIKLFDSYFPNITVNVYVKVKLKVLFLFPF